MSLASFVRRADPDRYFCALFAPAEHRETLFALYAFNHELARACEITREPGLALIRLQWWREVVEGEARAHEVAGPLRAALSTGALPECDLLAMIEAREREAEGGFEALDQWLDWLRQGAGSLMVAAGRALGAPPEAWPRLRNLGTAEGLSGQLRNLPANNAAGRSLLPACMQPRDLAQHGRTLMGPPLACDPSWIAAALPAALARRHLDRPGHTETPHGVSAKFAVLLARLRLEC